MSTRTLATLLLTAAVCGQAAQAQQPDPRATMLVTPAQLAASLDDPNLVLLHVGDRAEYNAEHIPGARFISLQSISVSRDNLALEMPTAEELRSLLEAAGVSDGSRVVVYFGRDWVTPSTRVMFTLAHAGLDRVALLDGGMGAWKKAGHPVTDTAQAGGESGGASGKKGTLSPFTPRDDIADAAYLQKHLGRPGFALIDARDADFYNGTREGGPRDRRVAGHITGAVSVPYASIAGPDMALKSRAELEAIFAAAGVKPGDTLVTYCHIGQQATAVFFAARTLGYKVRLYDGSFEDWVRRGLPVTSGK